MRYYIIAGEASGDLHGSNLIKALLKEDPDAVFRFWGGDLMKESAGERGTLVRHYKEAAVMGVIEVVAKAKVISDRIKFCRKDISANDLDVLILIDYPAFNLKMAEFAHKQGLKVFYYIAPKLWARAENRIKKIRKYVDELFIIFPFEKEYFKRLGVDAHYFGNPLLDSISSYPFSSVGESGKRCVALLAGSRRTEIKWLLPRMLKVESLMSGDSRWDNYQLLLAAAPSVDNSLYASMIPAGSSIKVIHGHTYDILKQSDAAIVSSGTASLETALIGTPQVVCYGFNRITYLIARMIVKVKYISLANLILDKLIFKELIQDNASPENIYGELCRLVFDGDCKEKMKADYDELRSQMEGEGPSAMIARFMIAALR